MIPFERTRQQTIPNSAVKIVGVGGAGANMLDRIALDGMDGAELLAINTDVRTLASSVAAEKIQLGRNLTKGLGTGGDPALGRRAAAEAELEIRDALRDRKIVFICVGLGGGTGSGAAPLVARLAREQGAFTVVFATMPFAFEGQRRKEQAENALTEVSAISNALVTFDNTRMGELVLAKQGVHEAFGAADRMISESMKAVTRIVLRPGLVNIGLDDLVSALSSTKSRCLFGSGLAEGENRAQKALKNALVSPLLDRGSLLNDATTVLVHICGGEDLTLYEIELLMRGLSKHIPDSAQLLFGTAVDPGMGDTVSVTLVSSLPEEKLLKGTSSEQEIAPPPRKEEIDKKSPGAGSGDDSGEEEAEPGEADPEPTVAQLTASAAPVTARAVEAPPVKASLPMKRPESAAPAVTKPPQASSSSAESVPVEASASGVETARSEDLASRQEPVASEEIDSEEPMMASGPEGGAAAATKVDKSRLKAVPAAPFKKLKLKVREMEANPVKSPKAVAAKEASANGKAPGAFAKAKGFIVTKGAKAEEAPTQEAPVDAPETIADSSPPSRPPLPELGGKVKAASPIDSNLGELEDLDDIDAPGGESGADRGKVDLRTRRVKLPPKRQGSTIREVRDVHEGGEETQAPTGKVSTLPPAPVPMVAPADLQDDGSATDGDPAQGAAVAPPREDDDTGVAFETIEPGTGEAVDLRTTIEELQAAADFDPKSQTELALEGGPKGRFEGEEPNVIDGEDLDVPPFLRRQS